MKEEWRKNDEQKEQSNSKENESIEKKEEDNANIQPIVDNSIKETESKQEIINKEESNQEPSKGESKPLVSISELIKESHPTEPQKIEETPKIEERKEEEKKPKTSLTDFLKNLSQKNMKKKGRTIFHTTLDKSSLLVFPLSWEVLWTFFFSFPLLHNTEPVPYAHPQQMHSHTYPSR